MTNAQYNALIDRIEAKYVVKVFNALKSQISSFTDDLQASGLNVALNNMDTDLFNEKIAVVIRQMYKEVGLFAAKNTYEALQKYKVKRITPGFIQDWLNGINNYFNDYIFKKIVIPITQKTKEQIRAVIDEGLKEGYSYDKVVSRLKDPELIRWRAKMIVRTETASALGRGQYEGAKSYEYVVVKEWQFVKTDDRTRDAHKSHTGVGGEKVGVDERFSNGLLHPGDKAGSAGQVINCRCRMAIRPKRDERGRLIPI